MHKRAWLLLLLAAGCAGDTEPKGTGDDDDDDDSAGTTDTTGTDTDTDTGSVVPTSDHPCHDEPLSLTVGTGITEYVPLAPGDAVEIVHGPQGGWHIDVGGLLSHTLDLVEISAVVVVRSTGAQIGGDQQPQRQALVGWSEPDCSGSFYGLRLFIDDQSPNQADICALEGEALDLEVTVQNLEAPAVRSTQAIELVAALDPNDVPFCDGSAL